MFLAATDEVPLSHNLLVPCFICSMPGLQVPSWVAIGCASVPNSVPPVRRFSRFGHGWVTDEQSLELCPAFAPSKRVEGATGIVPVQFVISGDRGSFEWEKTAVISNIPKRRELLAIRHRTVTFRDRVNSVFPKFERPIGPRDRGND